MHSPPEQLGQQHVVMLEHKDKRGLENSIYCEASGIKPGVTAVEQILIRDQGSPQSEEAWEIIHNLLMNCHRLGKNRLKRKQETRSKVKGLWVELEAGPGRIAESWCWCCRQMLARARLLQGKRETCQGGEELTYKLALQL